MVPSVTTILLSIHPFTYTFSPPPYFIHPSINLQFLFANNGPTNKNNQLWLGGSKLHSKLWFFYLYYLVLCSWIKIWSMKGGWTCKHQLVPFKRWKKDLFCHISPSLFMNIYIHAWIINEHLRSEMSSSSINNCQIINDWNLSLRRNVSYFWLFVACLC